MQQRTLLTFDPRGLSVPAPGQNTCIPPFSNIFSIEAAWSIKAKFYVEPLWEGEGKFI